MKIDTSLIIELSKYANNCNDSEMVEKKSKIIVKSKFLILSEISGTSQNK